MVNMITMPLIEVDKKATLTGHRDCIYSLEKTHHPSLFFSAGGDGMVVLWDISNPENGELVAQVENSVYAMAFDEENQHVFIGQNFKGIHLIDYKNKKEIASSSITTSYIFSIQIFKNKVFVGTGDGYLVILSKEDLTTIAKIKLSDQSIRSIAISPDGQYLAVGSSDNTLRILSVNTYTLLKQWEGHSNSVFTVKFTPDGNYLLSGSRDAHLKIWDVSNDFQLHKSVIAHMYAINQIAFHPQEKFLATCSMDKSIKIWNAENFELLKVIDKSRHAGHGTSVNSIIWSSYLNTLVAAGDDRTISVWDIKINV